MPAIAGRLRQLLLPAAAALAGCGGATAAHDGAAPHPLAATLPAAPAHAVAVPIGRGPGFQAPVTGAALLGAPLRGMACLPEAGPRVGAHLELFAAGRVVLVPAGLGIAARARCSYPVRTRERTGLLELRPTARLTLADVFALWGRPLSRTTLAGFRGRVRAYVDGRRVPGDPRRIALARHRQIVLAVGPAVPVHPSYRFPEGL